MTTGERIKILRKERGMTQEELGKKIGVQKAAINKYETGLVVNLKRSTIHALSKALEVPVTLLLDEETDDLSQNERQLINYYREAEEPIRDAAMTMLKNSAEKSIVQKQDTTEEQMA